MRDPNEEERKEQEQEAVGAYRRLLDHKLLEQDEVNDLTFRIRRRRTLTSLEEEAPQGGERGLLIAQKAIDGMKSAEPQWAQNCAETLPATTVRAAVASECDCPATEVPPPAGWERWWKDVREEGRSARDQMARYNQRLVAKVAREHVSGGMDMEDIHQMGNIGLLTAIERYDERTGNRFSTYAFWWVRQAMQHGIAQESRDIRLPGHVHANMRAVHAATAYLSVALGRMPTDEEVAERTGKTADQVAALRLLSRDTVSLDAPVQTGGAEMTEADAMIRRLWDQMAPSPEGEAMVNHMGQDVRRALSHLPERSRQIICARFGIDDGESRTLREIASDFKLSPQRISQIEKRALKDLKQLMLNEGMASYLEGIGTE